MEDNCFTMLCWFLLHNSVSQLCLHVCSVAQSCPTFLDPMDCSHQAPLSMGFPGQEYWRGFPFPSPEDLPNPGIEPVSLVSPALAGGCFPLSHPGSPKSAINIHLSTPPHLCVCPNHPPSQPCKSSQSNR